MKAINLTMRLMPWDKELRLSANDAESAKFLTELYNALLCGQVTLIEDGMGIDYVSKAFVHES